MDCVNSNQNGIFRTVGEKRKSGGANPRPTKKSAQYSVPIGNRFELFKTVSEPAIVEEKTTRVPPIIVDSPMAQVESLLASCAIIVGVGNFTAKILNRSGRVRINARTKECHTKLMLELSNLKKHEYHSFTAENDREYSAVVLGLYEMDVETIKKGIVDAGIKDVKAVAKKSTRGNTVLYVVRFARGSTTIKELQEKCGKLCHCVVTWQQFSPAVKEYTQCRNCQQFGHAGTNCRRKHRCIKCLGEHIKGECPRTTREGTAKCVNCKGDHAANYKGCAAYQQYKAVKTSQQIQRYDKPTYVPAPAPPSNFWEKRAQNSINPTKFAPYNTVFPSLQKAPKTAPPDVRPPTSAPAPAASTTPSTNPFAELQKLQQELLAIENIWEIIAEYRKIITALKSSASPAEAAMALFTATCNFNG